LPHRRCPTSPIAAGTCRCRRQAPLHCATIRRVTSAVTQEPLPRSRDAGSRAPDATPTRIMPANIAQAPMPKKACCPTDTGPPYPASRFRTCASVGLVIMNNVLHQAAPGKRGQDKPDPDQDQYPVTGVGASRCAGGDVRGLSVHPAGTGRAVAPAAGLERPDAPPGSAILGLTAPPPSAPRR